MIDRSPGGLLREEAVTNPWSSFVSIISTLSAQWNLWRAEHALAKTDKAIAQIPTDPKQGDAKAGLSTVIKSASKAEQRLSKVLAAAEGAKLTSGDTARLTQALAAIKDAQAGAQGMIEGKWDVDPAKLGQVAAEAHKSFTPANLHVASHKLRDKFVVKGLRNDALDGIADTRVAVGKLSATDPKDPAYQKGLTGAAGSIGEAATAVTKLSSREFHGFAPDLGKQLQPAAAAIESVQKDDIGKAVDTKSPLADAKATDQKLVAASDTVTGAVQPWKPETKLPPTTPPPATPPPPAKK